jgi:predicted negative regulator of RcsB-dependent stress response
MATPLDLQEQEQLDAVKAFWKQYGNLITWLLVLALGAFAAWNGWNWYQREQADKAAAIFDELERAAAGTGDAERVQRIFGDLSKQYPGTAFAQQGALITAKVLADKGKGSEALAALDWAASNAVHEEFRSLALLRKAGLLLDDKQFDPALAALDGAKTPAFAALVAERRGDILSAQGKTEEAVKAWQAAYQAMPETEALRRVVEIKLNAAGAPPKPASGVSR